MRYDDDHKPPKLYVQRSTIQYSTVRTVGSMEPRPEVPLSQGTNRRLCGAGVLLMGGEGMRRARALVRKPALGRWSIQPDGPHPEWEGKLSEKN